jgi:hypothetical protein
MTLDKRVTALEVKLKSQPAPEPSVLTPERLAALKLRLEKFTRRDLEAEARHNALPLEEQLALLRASREHELAERQARPGEGNPNPIDLLGDRIFEHTERDLERRVAERDGECR